ncbi:MAG: hypothetical protein EOM20_20845 [Spartobacteria bacterium]|nr:hypothetical protein [Spartobacteria bacterium]
MSANGDFEGETLYVRNGPPLSQAELGFIPTGEPWTTIDLFSDNGRKLLKVLRDADQPMTNQLYGTVNPNTSYPEVLQMLFLDAPIEEYPGHPDPPRISLEQAKLIATGIVEYTSQPLSKGDSLDSAAAWVTTKAFEPNGTLSANKDLNNNQKEGIIRNSYRLFNANNNLFTYVVVAQAIQDDDNIGVWDSTTNDIPVGETIITALVWRDPFPQSRTNATHTQFIRRLKYIEDVD